MSIRIDIDIVDIRVFSKKIYLTLHDNLYPGEPGVPAEHSADPGVEAAGQLHPGRGPSQVTPPRPAGTKPKSMLSNVN